MRTVAWTASSWESRPRHTNRPPEGWAAFTALGVIGPKAPEVRPRGPGAASGVPGVLVPGPGGSTVLRVARLGVVPTALAALADPNAKVLRRPTSGPRRDDGVG
jgi:hypothetical protein